MTVESDIMELIPDGIEMRAVIDKSPSIHYLNSLIG